MSFQIPNRKRQFRHVHVKFRNILNTKMLISFKGLKNLLTSLKLHFPVPLFSDMLVIQGLCYIYHHKVLFAWTASSQSVSSENFLLRCKLTGVKGTA